MLSAVRENMNKELEEYYARINNETIDLNTTIWKKSFVEFKTFYEIFNDDKLVLTKSEDVVKSIIFTDCYCEKLLCDEINLDDQYRVYIILTLINIRTHILDIMKSNNGRIPGDPLFSLMFNSNKILYKSLNKVLTLINNQ